jgi:hypothetical protein
VEIKMTYFGNLVEAISMFSLSLIVDARIIDLDHHAQFQVLFLL